MAGRFLADQITFQGEIPADLKTAGIRGRTVALYKPYEARESETGQELDNNQLLRRILANSDIDIMLRTIGNAFFPRVIPIQTAPTVIIEPNRQPKGYVLINPNMTVSGVATSVTVFPAATVFPAGATNSTSVNVSGFRSARFFLNISGAGGTVQVDAQTQDPVSGLWADSQLDLFSGSFGIGTYYASIGDLGVDTALRLVVTVVGAAVTGSIGAVLKEAYGATIAGPTIFLGGDSVNLTTGFPVLSGSREVFYLKENTPLYGLATAVTNINLFELQ
jgi:hypothetical protein